MTDASPTPEDLLAGYRCGVTPHLARLGCVEIPRAEYLKHLERALGRRARWQDN